MTSLRERARLNDLVGSILLRVRPHTGPLTVRQFDALARFLHNELSGFDQEARQEEREACAKVAEQREEFAKIGIGAPAAIRARGEK